MPTLTENPPRGVDFATALDLMRIGHAVSREAWAAGDTQTPVCIILVRGREIIASFGPMVSVLFKGAKFKVRDHIDAIFIAAGDKAPPECVVGFEVSTADALANDWYLIP